MIINEEFIGRSLQIYSEYCALRRQISRMSLLFEQMTANPVLCIGRQTMRRRTKIKYIMSHSLGGFTENSETKYCAAAVLTFGL